MKRRIGTIILVVALAISLGLIPVAPVSANPGPDLVGLWHFDEGSGTTVTDDSGNGNDGTIHGADWNGSDQWGGDCLNFNGSSDYVAVTDPGGIANLDGFSGLTLEAWINPDRVDLGYWPAIISKYNSNTGYVSYWLRQYQDEIEVAVYDGDHPFSTGDLGIATTTNVNLVAGSWYHVAGTWDGSTFKLYVNGVSEPWAFRAGYDDIPAIMADNSVDVELGAFQSNSSGDRFGFFDGLIDEVRIWNGALTIDEIGLDLGDVTVNAVGSDLQVEIDYELGSPYIGISDSDTTEFTLESVIESTPVTLTAPSTHTEDYTFYAFDHWTVTNLIDTVTIPTNDDDGVESNISLDSGVTYLFEVSGTYQFGWANEGADAEWADWYGWTKTPGYTYHSKPEHHLDLLVDGSGIDWGDYSPDHKYSYQYIGDGSTVEFMISDDVGWYGDNDGDLTVKIWQYDIGAIFTDNSVTFEVAAPETKATAYYNTVLIVNKELTPTDTVIVPTNDENGAESNIILENGEAYLFEVSGNYDFGWHNYGADAEWADWNGWTKTPGYPPKPEYHLDLLIDGSDVDWGDYSPDHEYSYQYIGDGSTVEFMISDDVSGYGDNDGELTVQIWKFDPQAVPIKTSVDFSMKITVHAYDTVTDVYVEDGIGADLVVDTPAIGSYPDYPDTGQSVEVWKASTRGRMSATKIGWTIGSPTVCDDYTLGIDVHTGLNPRDKQEYTSIGDHDINSGPKVCFRYDGTMYCMQGPSVTVTAVEYDLVDD